VRAGTVKAYAVTAKTRLAAAPDIPTVDAAGRSGGASTPRRSRPGFSASRRADAGALGALQKAEIEKWWPIIKAAGIKAE